MVPLIYYRGALISYNIDREGDNIEIIIRYHIQYFKIKTTKIKYEFDEELSLNQLIKASKTVIDEFNKKYTLF